MFLQAVMYVNLIHIVIALGTLGTAFGGVLFFEPKSATVKNIPCPDGGTCPDSNTCCMLESLRYGCCPMPEVSAIT